MRLGGIGTEESDTEKVCKVMGQLVTVEKMEQAD